MGWGLINILLWVYIFYFGVLTIYCLGFKKCFPRDFHYILDRGPGLKNVFSSAWADCAGWLLAAWMGWLAAVWDGWLPCCWLGCLADWPGWAGWPWEKVELKKLISYATSGRSAHLKVIVHRSSFYKVFIKKQCLR